MDPPQSDPAVCPTSRGKRIRMTLESSSLAPVPRSFIDLLPITVSTYCRSAPAPAPPSIPLFHGSLFASPALSTSRSCVTSDGKFDFGGMSFGESTGFVPAPVLASVPAPAPALGFLGLPLEPQSGVKTFVFPLPVATSASASASASASVSATASATAYVVPLSVQARELHDRSHRETQSLLAEWRAEQFQHGISLTTKDITDKCGEIYQDLVRDILRTFGFTFEEEVPIMRRGREVSSLDVKIDRSVEQFGFSAKNIIVEIKYSIQPHTYDRLLQQIRTQLGAVHDSIMIVFCEKGQDLLGFMTFFRTKELRDDIVKRIYFVVGFSELLRYIRPDVMPMEV